MRKLIILFIILLSAFSCNVFSEEQTEKNYVFKNVNVIPMNEEVILNKEDPILLYENSKKQA